MRSRKNRYTVAYRRRREGRTDYKLRLRLLKSRKPRLVVRRTASGVILQLVEYAPDGDLVRITVESRMLKKHGWPHATKNLPAAFLAGYWLGRLARARGLNEAILDLGLQYPHPKGRLYAALAGALRAGMLIPHSPDVLPDEERLMGGHLEGNVKTSVEEMLVKLDKLVPLAE